MCGFSEMKKNSGRMKHARDSQMKGKGIHCHLQYSDATVEGRNETLRVCCYKKIINHTVGHDASDTEQSYHYRPEVDYFPVRA